MFFLIQVFVLENIAYHNVPLFVFEEYCFSDIAYYELGLLTVAKAKPKTEVDT